MRRESEEMEEKLQREMDDLHFFYTKQLNNQKLDLERYINYDRSNLSKIDELTRENNSIRQRLHFTHSQYTQAEDSLKSTTQDLQKMKSDFHALIKFLEIGD